MTARAQRGQPARRRSHSPRLNPHHITLILIGAAAALGFFLALASIAPFGTGISRDSVEYLAVARSLLAGEGLLSFDGRPLDLWPPFYPIVLAFTGWISASDPFVSGGWLNAALYGLAIFLMGNYLRITFPQRRIWAIAGAILVLIAPAFFSLSMNLLSDLLFIDLCLLFLTLASRWFARPGAGGLVGMGLLAGVTVVTRYIGFELVLIGLAVILAKRDAWQARFRRAGAFAAAAGAPLALWALRNLAVSGQPLGPRTAARRSFEENLQAMGYQLRLWLAPEDTALSERVLYAIYLLLIVAAVWLVIHTLRRPDAHLRPVWAILLLAFGLAYLPLLLLSASLTDVTTIDLRLVMPAYPTFILVICLALDGLLARAGALSSWRLALAAGVILAGWGFLPALDSFHMLVQARENGAPLFNYLNTREFQESGVTAYLKANPIQPDVTVYSNYPTATYLYSGHRADNSPESNHPHNDEIQYPVEQYSGAWPDRTPALLVWYNIGPFTHYHPPEALQAVARLTPLYEGGDGGVYVVETP